MRDEDFVEEVYTGPYRRLVGQLLLICGDLPTAEDIVSEPLDLSRRASRVDGCPAREIRDVRRQRQ